MPAKIQIASLFFNIEGETKDLQKGVKDAEGIIKNAFGKMTASGDAVIKSTDNLTKSMGQTKRSSVDLASKMLIVERAYADVKRVVQGGVDMARLGASMQRVERRFDAFARQAGGSTELLEAFQRGAGGTVDKLNAMNTAALLLQQGLVTNAAEMEKTVELATRLGNQTLSATDRMNEFGQLLRNQSIRLLDNFGISSGRVRTRIKELQEATAGLSREEAFRIAVFEEGQKALDILGERVDDNAAKFEKAQARLADWRIEMGERFAPIVAEVMNFISGLDSATIALVTAFTGAVGITAKFTGGLGGLVDKLGLTAGQFGAISLGIGGAIAAYELINRAQADFRVAQEESTVAIQDWIAALKEAERVGGDTESAIRGAAKEVNNLRDEYDRTNIVAQIANDIGKQQADRTKLVNDAILEASGSYEDYIENVEIFNSTVDKATAKIFLHENRLTETKRVVMAFSEEQFKASKMVDAAAFSFGAASDSIDTLNAKMRTLAKIEEEEVARATELIAEKSLELKDVLSIAESAIGDTGRSLDSVKIALRDVSAEQIKVRDDIELLSRAYSEGIVSVQEFTDRIRDAEQGQLDLSLAQRKQLTEALNQKIAMEEYRESLIKTREEEEKRLQTLKDQIRSQIEQAEALKDASEQDIARAAIRRLEQAEKEGKIGFEEFTEAVVEIQDKFGLADDRSRALTSGLGELVDGLVSGSFAASEMDDALSLMIADAADGVIVFEDLVNQIGLMNSNLGETQRVFDALTGQFMEVPRMAQPTGMREISAGPAVGGGMGSIIDALTGQITQPGQQQAPSTQVFIENLNLTGVQSAEDFLASLQGVTG